MATSHPEQANKEGLSPAVRDQMLATVYGQSIGDALGLLTEFLTKEEAEEYYGKKPKDLSYSGKEPDPHRTRWQNGDWTDDTDQMILIMQSLLYNKGEVSILDFAARVKRWSQRGFPEHGDTVGMGIGQSTRLVLQSKDYCADPQKSAREFWERKYCKIAPNGAVMRTSILGLHQWNDIEAVKKNAVEICKTTHYDPRCQASCVAVSVCIALMMQHRAKPKAGKISSHQVTSLIKNSYDHASQMLQTEEEREELWTYMNCTKLKELELSGAGKIGYTYKCMGSGFWALKKDNFKKALIKLIMEGGDADTNAAVAGALLGCRLGLSSLPEHWVSGLRYRDWLIGLFNRFVKLQSEMHLPIEQRTACDDLNVETMDNTIVPQKSDTQTPKA